MVLANMQEQAIKQQEQIQQWNIDNQYIIHYTIWNPVKRLSTAYGFISATNLTPLVIEISGSNKSTMPSTSYSFH